MIDTSKSAFPRPSEREGKVTLRPKERRELLNRLCREQGMRCAECDCLMTRDTGELTSAGLGHRKCEPMGAKKRDNLDNIIGAICNKCNGLQGSKPK